MNAIIPDHGFFGRMRIYFAEMYPPPARLLTAGLAYLAIAAFAVSVHGGTIPLAAAHTAVGIWSIFALMLILRLMDEIKDSDIDAALFPDRPLPSGRVRESDIVFTLATVSVLFVAANLWSGAALWLALFALGYAFLMFRYFFARDLLRRNLLITLATHNPIIAIVVVYCIALAVGQAGISPDQIDWGISLPFVAMVWAPFLAWEIARKIRAPEEEDAYVTYSRIFGRRGAVAFALCAQTAALAIGIYLFRTLDLSPFYPTALFFGYGVMVRAYARFLAEPSPTTSRLEAPAQGFAAMLLAVQVVEFGLFARL